MEFGSSRKRRLQIVLEEARRVQAEAIETRLELQHRRANLQRLVSGLNRPGTKEP